MTYRAISKVAKCSQGAVSAEIRAWNEEKAKGIELPLDGDIPEAEAQSPPPIPSKLPALELEAPQTKNVQIERF